MAFSPSFPEWEGPLDVGLHRTHGPTVMTVQQAVELLQAVEHLPGGVRDHLEVFRTGREPLHLAAPEDLAAIEDLDEVEQITQRTRFGDRGQYVLVLNGDGIAMGSFDLTHGAPFPAASAEVGESYRRLGLRPAPPDSSACLLTVAAAAIGLLTFMLVVLGGFGPADGGVFWGLWLPVLTTGLVMAGAVAGVLTVARRSSNHWLQRGAVRRRVRAADLASLAVLGGAGVVETAILKPVTRDVIDGERGDESSEDGLLSSLEQEDEASL